jgi:hypothetical protein
MLMAQVDLDKMLVKIKATQWGLGDVDWDAPGADMIGPEQWPKLKAFMADVMWVEHVGARGFAALARTAPTETLREIYTYFQAEEQRHANAEMALMRRWGMLDGDELPEPNVNLRLVIAWLDKYADELPFYVLGATIPMLEVALDGALCRFLLDTVDDPVCHAVFDLINGDEARHLAVGFSVMEHQCDDVDTLGLLKMCAPALHPRTLLGGLVYVPLLSKMRDNLIELGLPEHKLIDAMARFGKNGGRTPNGRRNPYFLLARRHARRFSDRSDKSYHVPANLAVRVTAHIPRWALPPVPSWVKELTWKPVS